MGMFLLIFQLTLKVILTLGKIKVRFSGMVSWTISKSFIIVQIFKFKVLTVLSI